MLTARGACVRLTTYFLPSKATNPVYRLFVARGEFLGGSGLFTLWFSQRWSTEYWCGGSRRYRIFGRRVRYWRCQCSRSRLEALIAPVTMKTSIVLRHVMIVS